MPPSRVAAEYEAELDALQARLDAAEAALRAIRRNAEAFHKGEDGKARALAVIAGWAANPGSAPASLPGAAFDGLTRPGTET